MSDETPYSLRRLPKGSYIPEGHYGAVTQAAKQVLRNSEGRWDSGLGAKGVQRSDPKSYLQPVNTTTALIKYRLYSVDALTQIAPDFVLSVDIPETGSPYFHLVTEDSHGANDGALLKMVGLYEPLRVAVSDTADFVPQFGQSCGPDETGRVDSSYTGYVCISSVETVEAIDTVWVVQHNTQALYAEAIETIAAESRGLFKALKRDRDTDDLTDLAFLPSLEAYTENQINIGARAILVPVHRLGWMAINAVGGGTIGTLVECPFAAGLLQGDGYILSPMEVSLTGITLTNFPADLISQGEDFINSLHRIEMLLCQGSVSFTPVYLDNSGQPQNNVSFSVTLQKVSGFWRVTLSITEDGFPLESWLFNVSTPSDDVSANYLLAPYAAGAPFTYIDATGQGGFIQPPTFSSPSPGLPVPLNIGETYFYDPAALVTSLTLALPGSANDGDTVNVIFGGQIPAGDPVVTSFNFSGGTVYGATFPATVSGGDSIVLAYRALTSTWYVK